MINPDANPTERRVISLTLFALIIAYAALSGFFFGVEDVPMRRVVVEDYWRSLFIFGPPVALLYREAFVWFFIFSTAAFWSFVLMAVFAKNRFTKMLCVSSAAATWIIGGFISAGISSV